jgi:hypothetical protein
MARNGHGGMSDLSPLSGVKRKSDLGADTSGFDPNETWAHGRRGAPRCRAGLEHLTPSAQLTVAGPSLLILEQT